MNLKHIETKLARATTLPILPSIVMQVLALKDNPDVGTREYERVIAQDPAMTTKILRTANSSYYGGNGHITTLQRAVAQLGVNAIRSICMAVAFQSALNAKALSKSFRVGTFWQHSIAVACASKVLAHLSRVVPPEEAFIAGMMHDIGKLALCMFLPAETEEICRFADKNQKSYFEIEERYLGLTHQDAGALTAGSWGIPEIYIPPITRHHAPLPLDLEECPLVACVHVANVLAHDAGLGFGVSSHTDGPDAEAIAFLGIPEAQFDAIRLGIAKEVARMSEQMGVPVG